MIRILKIAAKGCSGIVNITSKVQKIVDKEGVRNGIVNLFVVGSTGSVTTCEDDPNIYKDIREVLEEIAPYDKDWRHHQTWGDKNGASHIRATMFGPSLTIPIVDGKLVLGTWQQIILINFDTKDRERKVAVTIFSV